LIVCCALRIGCTPCALAAGTPRRRADGNTRGCRAVHDWIKPGDAFDKARADACLMAVQPPAEGQVPAAGYRLARVLNELFG